LGRHKRHFRKQNEGAHFKAVLGALLSTRRPTWRAGDAAGAASNLARFSYAVRAVSGAIYQSCQRHT